MFCVRWKAGESRRCKAFAGLAADHPAADMECLFCTTPLRDATPLGGCDGEPEKVQLIAVGLVDPDEETRAKFEAGRWCSVGAVLLHEGCAEAMTDEQLEGFIASLVVLPAAQRCSCGRTIVRANLDPAAATAWKSHVWLDEDGLSGLDAGLPTFHEHAPEES